MIALMATSLQAIMTALVKDFLHWKRRMTLSREMGNNNIEPLPQPRNKLNSMKFINEQKIII
jgi:hypothetical protein